MNAQQLIAKLADLDPRTAIVVRDSAGSTLAYEPNTVWAETTHDGEEVVTLWIDTADAERALLMVEP